MMEEPAYESRLTDALKIQKLGLVSYHNVVYIFEEFFGNGKSVEFLGNGNSIEGFFGNGSSLKSSLDDGMSPNGKSAEKFLGKRFSTKNDPCSISTKTFTLIGLIRLTFFVELDEVLFLCIPIEFLLAGLVPENVTYRVMNRQIPRSRLRIIK